MLSGQFIITAFYVRTRHCHNNITCEQKLVLHGVGIDLTKWKRKTYSEDKCLPPVFRNELKSFFTRLYHTELLQRCFNGQTQNANEAISSLLWSRYPESVFCSKTKLKACAAV